MSARIETTEQILFDFILTLVQVTLHRSGSLLNELYGKNKIV
jgi:hypothetical protein